MSNNFVPRHAKAIFAAVSSALGGVLLVIEDGLTATEGLQVAATVLAIVGGVYGLTNAPNTTPIDEPRI